MNRKNVDNIRFVDFDEFLLMDIKELPYVDSSNAEKIVIKKHYRVDGITKAGLTVEGLYLDVQSNSDKGCFKFIMDNWVSKK